MRIKLSANLIFVTDILRAKKWYEDVFGMVTEEFRPPEFLQMRLGSNVFYIETANEKRASGFRDTKVGGRHSAVFEVEEITEVISNLRGRGVTVVVDPVQQFWGGWNAVIADPDGNEFILDEDR